MNDKALAAKQYTEQYGIHIVPVPPGTKGPRTKGWGKNLFPNGDAAAGYFMLNPEWNLGVILGPSGFGSLDIDDLTSFELIVKEFGLEEEFEELKRFPTIQGDPEKGYRIMFRIPEDATFGRNSVAWPLKEDATKTGVVFELRAACKGEQLQDMLPPSIHPDTRKPYKWITHPPSTLEEWPYIPAWLEAIWSGWKSFEPQFKDACPWVEKKLVKPPKVEPVQKVYSEQAGGNVSLIQEYIDAHDLESELSRHGYKRKSDGRWMYPGSSTKTGGVVIDTCGKRAFNHHGSDPLGSVGGKPMNAFDLYCYYEHNNDVRKAVRQIAEDMGFDTKPERKLTMKREESTEAGQPKKERKEKKQVVRQMYSAVPANAPFRVLGYNEDKFYYLPFASEQVCSMTASAHTNPGAMLKLATLQWWTHHFPKDPDNHAKGVDWQAAASACISDAHKVGVYSAENVRGCGAWFDEGRSVVHAGDCLLVDGERVAIKDFETKFIYQKRETLDPYIDAPPATDEQARKVLEAFILMNWQNSSHAMFAAGWLALASACGGLEWRPHLWLTGRSGSGKTWVQQNVVVPLLGKTMFKFMGGTSEAGLRQTVGPDARPAMLDEAESETQKAREAIQGIIELARASSSNNEAAIVKGTSGGSAIAFKPKFMVFMGSINVALNMAADNSRFAVVELVPAPETEDAQVRWRRLKEIKNTCFDDPMFCASIRNRIYRLIPAIRKNAELLATLIRERVGSQRVGDQYGTLIAGAVALTHGDVMTIEEANKYIDNIDLTGAEEAKETTDEQMLLDEILQHQLRYDSDGGYQLTRSIREIMRVASGALLHDTGLSGKTARALLARYGIVVHLKGFVSIADTHKGLREILRGTAWESGHKKILARLPGAHRVSAVTMGSIDDANAKTTANAVRIPIEVFCLEEEDLQ